MRVSYQEMHGHFKKVCVSRGMSEKRADLCARLFAEASLDGVFSHGLNRFPLFIQYIDQGIVDPVAEPELVQSFGVIERWDGNRGVGNINAYYSMERAIELAKSHGLGCVALSNSNHWMRGGSYGWQAAEADCIGICWTNTMPNMPIWGSKEATVGNNPIVYAVPRDNGHLVLDMALSLYSFGQLYKYEAANELLPMDGGYDSEGNLTRDPSAILKADRILPIGYWKGTGLSLMLDIIAAALSGGLTTHEIGKIGGPKKDRQVCQVFLAIDMSILPDSNSIKDQIEAVINDLHKKPLAEGSSSIRYPGEDTLRRRKEYLHEGIPVDPVIWEQALSL